MKKIIFSIASLAIFYVHIAAAQLPLFGLGVVWAEEEEECQCGVDEDGECNPCPEEQGK